MVNKILQEINNRNWFILFQWQMEDGKLCVLFRRVSMPNFVIFASGHEESRVYGKAQVEIASFEEFIKKHQIEKKWGEFKAKNNEYFKYST